MEILREMGLPMAYDAQAHAVRVRHAGIELRGVRRVGPCDPVRFREDPIVGVWADDVGENCVVIYPATLGSSDSRLADQALCQDSTSLARGSEFSRKRP